MQLEKLKNSKIYVVGAGKEYANWMLGTLVDNMEGADLVVFTGGEDVSPEFYGAKKHPKTYCNTIRDLYEKKQFQRAKDLGIKCIGICRGSQFLCTMAGGQLVQHQDNPLYLHGLKTWDNNDFEITSTHHQAQYPYTIPKDNEGRDNYKILAWTENISRYHENGLQREMPLPLDKECEIVYYKNIDSLGIQGHPEHLFNKAGYENTILQVQTILNKFLHGYYKAVVNRNVTITESQNV